MRMQMRTLILLCTSLVLVSCSDEPGRSRADASQLQGTYLAKFDHGQERLELKADGTYLQEFFGPAGPVRHTGVWQLEHRFFDGTDVSLVEALVSEDDFPAKKRLGMRNLNVHRRNGEFALALNESADWYYVRVRE
jgi:hypothetical protein